VFIALSIGLLDYAGPGPQGLSWIAAIILLFPPIVPSTPRKTLATALLAASMDPAAALIWKATGKEVLGMPQVFILAAGNYLCAGVAAVISHIITRLGREVRKAREMGSYVLGDRIGSGGMGEVWQATHQLLVRPALEEIVLACLAKHPAERPASTRALADRLARCEVESPWTREDARRWWETSGAGERPGHPAGPQVSK